MARRCFFRVLGLPKQVVPRQTAKCGVVGRFVFDGPFEFRTAS
jgi:hypothetical protein